MSIGAPDVAGARDAQEAALREIEAHLGPESRDVILPILKREFSGPPGAIYHVKGKTPEWNARYERCYAALNHRFAEERREASIAWARRRGGIPVVVALGMPPSGAVAAVLRRYLTQPKDVVVLGPNANRETLGAAFAALDRSRQLYGDNLEQELVIGVSAVQATSVDVTALERLDEIITRLANANERTIEGLGTAPAIDVQSMALRAPDSP